MGSLEIPIFVFMVEPLFGAHMSISGGVHTAFERGESIGCTTMQVFVKNNNRWRGPELSDEDITNYKTAKGKSRIAPVIAHASYLINLCAVNKRIRRMSIDAFVDELSRCEALGIQGLVFHPGSHMGAGESDGISRIAEALDFIHDRTGQFKTRTVLETTAGQGTALGYRFEQIRGIIDLVKEEGRMGVCLDTCHVFAAGYDIRTRQGWNLLMKEFDNVVGLGCLIALHVNDSKKELGSRVDRHEQIGKGHIGDEGFRTMMNDRRLENVPKILETPKSDDMHEDVENLARLRSFLQMKSSGP